MSETLNSSPEQSESQKPTLLEMLRKEPISNFFKSLLTLTLSGDEMVGEVPARAYSTEHLMALAEGSEDPNDRAWAAGELSKREKKNQK